jgi:hypothetical protein
MYEDRILENLPAFIRNQFPFTITWRLAIDTTFIKTVISNGQSAMGPVSTVQVLRESMKNLYFESMESFLSRIKIMGESSHTPKFLVMPTRVKSLLKAEFPTLHIFFGGPLPTENLIYGALEVYQNRSVVEVPGNVGARLTRETYQHLMMQTIRGEFWKGDATCH